MSSITVAAAASRRAGRSAARRLPVNSQILRRYYKLVGAQIQPSAYACSRVSSSTSVGTGGAREDDRRWDEGWSQPKGLRQKAGARRGGHSHGI